MQDTASLGRFLVTAGTSGPGAAVVRSIADSGGLDHCGDRVELGPERRTRESAARHVRHARGMRTAFFGGRPAKYHPADHVPLMDAEDVAEVILSVVRARGAAIVPEIMITPGGQTSWP